jgi:hypothetical protein
MLVPSGTMLHVIVAGAPFPERAPEAVESHGSGVFVLIINAWAGFVANTAQKSTNNNTYAESRRMIKSGIAARPMNGAPNPIISLDRTGAHSVTRNRRPERDLS